MSWRRHRLSSRAPRSSRPRSSSLRLFAEARDRKTLAIEPVLTPGWPGRAELLGLGLATAPGASSYLPIAQGPLKERGGLLQRSLAELLAAPAVTKIGHDLKRALLALRRAGAPLPGPLIDVMLSAYCIDPSRPTYELEALVVDRFGHRLRDHPAGGGSLADVPVERVAPYAAERAELALRLADSLANELEALGQRRLLELIEMPLLPVLAEMEWNGIAIDAPLFATLGAEWARDLERLRHTIHAEAGVSFNIDSPLQLREVLFDKLGLPVIKRTKTGPSTDADVLLELSQRGYALPRYLVEYRQLAKLKSTYADALPAYADDSLRIHTTFNQAATATGRLSSSEPNLQNIPVQTPLGATLRQGFVAAPGSRMVAADYSQIELRVAAHLAGEPAFIEAFRAGRDVHRETAARIFDVDLDAVTDRMRGIAKVVNYATLYGQQPPSLARLLGIEVDEAEVFITGYFERFAAVRAFLDRQIRKARELGYVETILGRRRYIPELRARDPRLVRFGERVAQNSPIQGSAADLIKLAMIRIHARLRQAGLASRMLLQVHDELLFEAPEGELRALEDLVRAEMEGAVALTVPIHVDIGVGQSWYEAKLAAHAEPRSMVRSPVTWAAWAPR